MRNLLALLVMVIAVAPCAHAGEHDAEAKMLYQEGQKAYALGRFSDAANLFEQAYTASQRSALIFNIGSALQKQYDIDGKVEGLKKARALYTNYINDTSVPADGRADATERIVQIDALLANVPGATAAPTPALSVVPGVGDDLAQAQLDQPQQGTSRTWLWVTIGVIAAVAIGGVILAIALQPHDATVPADAHGNVLTVSFP